MGKRNVLIDLTGEKFGRLTVIGRDDKQTRKTYWICQCECGTIRSIRADALRGHKTVSCGCKKKEQDKENLSKHHSHLQSGTKLYKCWQGIKKRCFNKSDVRFHNYGGRGITICDEWKNDFSAFYEWSIENGYKEELTIDRINVNGNYEPNNCRWVDVKTQCNNRTTNIKITIGNATKTLTEWCEIFELDSRMVFARYSRNPEISIEQLFRANTEVSS